MDIALYVQGGTMEILSNIGALLLIILWVLAILLNYYEPKWYWEYFIPKLQKKETQHPVITSITLIIITMLVMYGVFTTVIRTFR